MFLILLISSFSGKYESFKVSVYTRAYEVEKMKNLTWLEETWALITNQVKIDKIYLETHRDLLIVPNSTIVQAKQFFSDRGIEVGGGITYTINESNSFETFCYSNEEHRAYVQQLAEITAQHHNDFILDDFFFTSCKSDIEIAAKGNQSWTSYRLKLLAEAGKNLVIDPAHRINPNVKVIIKYPNWYDHFPALGFDLSVGPKLFDGIWTGTETRDPGSHQHLQNYLSYNVIKYFDNIAPGKNGGGWVDTAQHQVGLDRYAEQLWLTFFAKTPEINLFAYNQLIGVPLQPSIHRTKWQGQGTSFDYDEMSAPYNLSTGETYVPTTVARAAGYTLEKIDKFISKLGNPRGVQSYKPYNSDGDDFLPNYLGMIGIPQDIRPEFPVNQSVVLLTEQAKTDPDIISKIKAQLVKGGDVVITTGLLKAIPEKIADIAEIKTTKVLLVNDFSDSGTTTKDILVTQTWFNTNDAWEVLSTGRPLNGGTSGVPMALRVPYSAGNLYVITIPEDFGNLYDLPPGILNVYREILSRDLGIRIEGESKIGLFLYDNGVFIVENFNDEPKTVRIILDDPTIDLLTDVVAFNIVPKQGTYFQVTLPPHSYRVLHEARLAVLRR